MTSSAPRYSGYRFPPEIISHAVWLYHRFGLSFRDVEDLLAEREVTVSYETIRQWCQTFGPDDPGRGAAAGAGWAIYGIWTSSSSPFRAGDSISGAPWTKTAT